MSAWSVVGDYSRPYHALVSLLQGLMAFILHDRGKILGFWEHMRARRSALWVFHPSKHQWNRNEIWWMKKKAFAPFFCLALSFSPILLYGFILLAVLSLRLAPVWSLSRWSRGGTWGAGGGLLPPLSPVSFPVFSPPPCIFTPVVRYMREKEKCDRWRRHALVVGERL